MDNFTVEQIQQALERVQTVREKCVLCLALFQEVGPQMGMDSFESVAIAKFIGLPEDIVEAAMKALEAEGLVAGKGASY